jgi:hypothetical protein
MTDKKQDVPAKIEPMVIHAQSGDRHLVGIGPIRVLLLNDDGGWFAQALEIDFSASGNSVAEVKKNFEKDFVATIHENLRVHGSIRPMLKLAPAEFWSKYFELSQRPQYWQVSEHVIKPVDASKPELPSNILVFYEPPVSKAA